MSLDFSYLDSLLEEESEELIEEAGEGYRHVWVMAECFDGSLTQATLEAVGQGREIADQFGVYLFSLLLGHDLEGALAKDLIYYGADKVLVGDDPALAPYQVEIYAKVLKDLVNERRPEILLLPASAMGNDLAPRLAQRLETGLISHCVQLSLDMAERLLLGTFARMGGEYFHTAACPVARPQMATLEPGYFTPAFRDEFRQGEVEQLKLDLENVEAKLTWLDMDAALEKRPISLAETPIIVAAGRGMKNEQGFALAEQLAEVLGGQAAGSRGALDEGWIDQTQQVGMTGQTVKPTLYIACGISGAIQHYLGMKESDFVVAINRDEEAPIMKAANVGLVGDSQEIVAALIEELSENWPKN
jgi:electron transfer flavoprotein alpha subunit